MSRAFFAYHLTHFFGPFSLESYYTNSNKPQEGDTVYVISGDDSDDSGKDYFLEGIFRLHRRQFGPHRLTSLKGEREDFNYRLFLRPLRVPDSPIAMRRADWYDRKDVHRYFSSGQNFNPIPSDYKPRFDELLAGFGLANEDELAVDLAEIDKRKDVEQTTRDALVQARIGQGKFRADVMHLWGRGEKCPLTGIDVPELLIASHIKPWRDCDDSERLDPHNGILLATHADKLFDRYLMSFKCEGGEFKCVLHPRVLGVAKGLGIRIGAPLVTTMIGLSSTQKLERYMDGHFKRYVERLRNETPSDER